MKSCNFLRLLHSLLLSASIRSTIGEVDISPSGVAAVCQAGDQLELTCSTSDSFLRWEFPVFPENMTHATTPVTSVGPSGVPPPLMISSSIINISRLSGPDTLPLISRIKIASVSRTLNGAVVNCFEGIQSRDVVATTTIRIIDLDQVLNFDLSIQSDTEEFLKDGIIVNLEWTLLNSLIYYQQFLRNVSVSANPPLNNVMPTGDMRVQLTLSYNTLYHVTSTQNSICRLLIRTVSFERIYNKCSDPMALTNALAVDYVDPALEGQNITFTCPPGQTLNGSNSSTCIGNRTWEPDPRDVKCIGIITNSESVVTTIIASCSNPSYVLRISDPARVIGETSRQEFDGNTDTCCSGFLITNANNTICLENGEWELDTSGMNCDCQGMTAMLRTALISVTCVLVVMSVFTVIAGIVCYHCISQRWRASRSPDTIKQPESHSNPKDTESELELKENVAYITLRPAA